MMTLGELLARRLDACPHKTALIHNHRTYSYADVGELTAGLTKFFIEHNLPPGSRIASMTKCEPALVATFLAASCARLVFCPVNTSLPVESFRKLITQLHPRGLVIHQEYYEGYQTLLKELFPDLLIIVTGDRITAKVSFDEITTATHGELMLEADPDEPCYLNFTSGSTGEAKAALTTHANMVWNTVASIETFNLTGDDVHLPLFAVHAHPHEIFCRSLATGGVAVLMDSRKPIEILRTIEQYRVTCVMATATLYEFMLPVAAARREQLKTLRIPESGGMVTAPDLIVRFRDQVGVPIYPVWGSTESTGIALAVRPDLSAPAGSVGKPCPHYTVELLTEPEPGTTQLIGDLAGCNQDLRDKLQEVREADGEVGIMVVSGPGIAEGYEFSPPNPESLREHRFVTGDYVRRDSQGFYYFLGRADGQIKVGGLKVFPEEVRQACLSHELIEDAVVVAVPDLLLGQVHAAVLQPRSSELDDLAVKRHLMKRLPSAKLPKFIIFVQSLPRQAGGKYEMTAIRALVADRIGSR